LAAGEDPQDPLVPSTSATKHRGVQIAYRMPQQDHQKDGSDEEREQE
jgi:hypothetical protein